MKGGAREKTILRLHERKCTEKQKDKARIRSEDLVVMD